MQRLSVEQLKEKARELRRHIIRMTAAAGSGHPGGSLSCVELVTALYFHELKHDVENPKWPDRDRFVLSKGHACPALYAALAEAGYVDPEGLTTLRKLDSPYQGHPDMQRLPLLEASSGSLGVGLSVALGLALNARIEGRAYRVYALIGDGESNEGQIWEAASFAAYHKIDNLVCITDYNKMQLDGFVKDILDMAPLAEKWRSFGWQVEEVDGHNFEELLKAFAAARQVRGKPVQILAHTVKGKGVSFMENVPRFHGMAPTPEEAEKALAELGQP